METQDSKTTSGGTDIRDLEGHYSWRGVYALLGVDTSFEDGQTSDDTTSRARTVASDDEQTSPGSAPSDTDEDAGTDTSPEITMSSFSTPTTERQGGRDEQHTTTSRHSTSEDAGTDAEVLER